MPPPPPPPLKTLSSTRELRIRDSSFNDCNKTGGATDGHLRSVGEGSARSQRRERTRTVPDSASLSATADRFSSIRLSFNDGGGGAEVRINDIILGNGVSGILHMWVSYGKGWRPRWFVLHDGVLSYYKIHGPDKGSNSKVIGDESMRGISHRQPSNRNRSNSTSHRHQIYQGKPIGEIHLMVSSIKESRSDEKKRFSIFTGTKRLHLRAQSQNDRKIWLDALQAAKGMFPPRMPSSELLAPTEKYVVSTQKLKLHLLQEGVNAAIIQSSEQIMRDEFSPFRDHLVALKQKQNILLETLRQLEVLKRDRFSSLDHA